MKLTDAMVYAMTEKELQAMVIEMAETLGLKVYHTHDSRRSQAGFPDLVIVGSSIEFWELKSEKGRLAPQQRDWILAIRKTGVYAGMFRPKDLAWMEARLRHLAA